MTAANRRRGQLRRFADPKAVAEHSRAIRRAVATPERAVRRLEVLRRFRAGESYGAIARALEIGKSTVLDDLKRIAPDALAERRRERAGEAEHRRKRDTAIRRARGKGHTLKRIAAAAGVTYQRIQALTRVAPIPDVTDAPHERSAARQDAPLDRPKRKCSNCGRTFQPTIQQRMLCAYCYRRGDPDGEE